jgi:hypothetical protein
MLISTKIFSKDMGIPLEKVQEMAKAGVLRMDRDCADLVDIKEFEKRGGLKDPSVRAWLLPREERDVEFKKKKLIEEYQRSNPNVSLKDAILAVGKAHPELFR